MKFIKIKTHLTFVFRSDSQWVCIYVMFTAVHNVNYSNSFCGNNNSHYNVSRIYRDEVSTNDIPKYYINIITTIMIIIVRYVSNDPKPD
jgi:hypothetical protein